MELLKVERWMFDMKDKKIYIIAYDVSNNKKRTRITKILSNYGVRIQKSVFKCLLNTEEKNKLILKLNFSIKLYTDNRSSDSLIVIEGIAAASIRFIEGEKISSFREKKYGII